MKEASKRASKQASKEGKKEGVHVFVCACVVLWRALVYSRVRLSFLRAGATEKSRVLSLSGSAPPFPKGVTLIVSRGKNSHRSSPCESRARDPEPFALTRVVRLQVAPWTCVKCPRAALREGVALRKLPIPPALVRASPR